MFSTWVMVNYNCVVLLFLSLAKHISIIKVKQYCHYCIKAIWPFVYQAKISNSSVRQNGNVPDNKGNLTQ